MNVATSTFHGLTTRNENISFFYYWRLLWFTHCGEWCDYVCKYQLLQRVWLSRSHCHRHFHLLTIGTVHELRWWKQRQLLYWNRRTQFFVVVSVHDTHHICRIQHSDMSVFGEINGSKHLISILLVFVCRLFTPSIRYHCIVIAYS